MSKTQLASSPKEVEVVNIYTTEASSSLASELQGAFLKLQETGSQDDNASLKVETNPKPLQDYENPFNVPVRFAEGYIKLLTGNTRNTKVFVPGDSTEAKADIKGNIVLFHGYGEHSTRYIHVANYFTKNGFRVVAMDHQFHGKDKDFVGQKITKQGSFETFYADAAAMLEQVGKAFASASEPLFAMGHSMGGLITLNACLKLQGEKAQQLNLKGVIFSAPAFLLPAVKGLGSLYKRPTAVLTGTVNAVMPSFAFAAVPAKLLTRSKEVLTTVPKDKLNFGNKMSCNFLRVFIKETRECLFKENGNATKLTLPFIIFQSDQDKAVDPVGAKKMMEKSTVEDKTLVEMNDCLHEILNDSEEQRNKMLQNIVDWISERK